MKTFFLVRHGETVREAPTAHMQFDQTALSEKGVAQSFELAVWLKTRSVEKVVTSPSVRAIQTATVISAALGVTLVIEDRFEGRNWGVITGRPASAIQEWLDSLSPEELKNPSVGPPGGESIGQVRARLMEALIELAESSVRSTVLVCHSSILRALVSTVNGEPPIADKKRDFELASITTIQYGDGRFTLLEENNTNHLS